MRGLSLGRQCLRDWVLSLFDFLISCFSLCLCVSAENDFWDFSVLSVVKKNLRIADLAQDRWSFGSGRGWNV
jgi:hypothetical protein